MGLSVIVALWSLMIPIFLILHGSKRAAVVYRDNNGSAVPKPYRRSFQYSGGGALIFTGGLVCVLSVPLEPLVGQEAFWGAATGTFVTCFALFEFIIRKLAHKRQRDIRISWYNK